MTNYILLNVNTTFLITMFGIGFTITLIIICIVTFFVGLVIMEKLGSLIKSLLARWLILKLKKVKYIRVYEVPQGRIYKILRVVKTDYDSVELVTKNLINSVESYLYVKLTAKGVVAITSGNKVKLIKDKESDAINTLYD